VSLVKSGEFKINDVDKEGQTPLMIAVDSGFSSQTVSQLIDLGCDVNAKNADGMTPLHLSYYNNSEVLFKQLLDSKADPSVKDNDDDSVVQLAEADDKTVFLSLLSDSSDLATSIPMDVYKA